MRKCAFLSMDSLDNFECYDHLLFEPFKKSGWDAEEISWRKPDVDWNRFDAVIIRSPWDYQQDPKAFFEVLRKIDRSSAWLENRLETVRWNIDKTYLRDLQARGVEIVPSLWKKTFNPGDTAHFFDELSTGEIIIKPTISAGADNTFRLTRPEIRRRKGQLKTVFSNRPFMVQPFMPKILTEGEFSLFYFGNTYSHAILKTPKENDFRVQEEHGGRLLTVKPEESLKNTAENVLALLDPLPLYTRIDFVRTNDETFALMELELIEPSLYFNMDPKSPERFARVFNEWMGNCEQ